MEEGRILTEGYSDMEKLELYDKTLLDLPIGKHLFTYSIKRLMPSVKGKVVLDLPCGNGHYVREMFNLGAAKVIASDIASPSIEMSKQRDQKAGIPDGFVEYYHHDSTIPKQLGSQLADVCLSLHLLCFAANESDLRGMIRMILTNLKPRGYCMVVACLLCPLDKDEVQKELNKIIDYEKVVHLDPPTTERYKPRRFYTIHAGFDFERYKI